MRTALRQALQLHAGRSWDGRLPSPGFQQTLTSIALDRGVGSPTFTRATTKSFVDWEGVVRTALAGEACFTGARRVRNLIAGSSVDATNVSYSASIGGTGIAVTRTANFAAAPDGTQTASRLQFNQGGGTTSGDLTVLSLSAPSQLASDTSRNSVYLRTNDGTTVNLLWRQGSGGAIEIITVTPNWQRFAGAVYTGTVGGQLGLRGTFTTAQTADILFWGCEIEAVTGQSNQNPSEYVSVGVLSAPFQGAGVDGVQYFATQNGNTVAANVVTAGNGAVIASSVLLGYSAWQASTNLVLQSENFGTTWTVIGTPTRSAAALRCGDVVLDLLGDADAATLDGYAQTISLTGDGVKAFSVFLAQGSSTGSRLRLVDSTAGTDRINAVVTWSVGVPTVTMTTGVLLGTDALGNGVYRVRIASTAVTAANTNQIAIYPASDASGTGTLTGNAYFGGVQAENLAFVTPYIATTTATVTRNADVLSYPLAGNVDNTAGTAYCEFSKSGAYVTNGRIVASTGANNNGLFANGTPNVDLHDGTNTAVQGIASGVTDKLAGYWQTAGMKVSANGVLGSLTSFDGDLGLTTAISIGHSGAAVNYANGNIRNVRIWNRALIDRNLSGRTV